MTHEIDTIPLDAVCINGGTQSRVALSEATIAEYAETIRSGTDLPPVVAFFDGVNFWLADGFHRYFAHKTAGAMEIAAEIREGTNRDAVLYSVGANASHGLRRTNEDKRRAVMTLLNDLEWAAWSDNAIAKACAVSHHTVAAMRAPILANSKIEQVRIVERNGKTYEQNTANIGKSASSFGTAQQVNECEQPAIGEPAATAEVLAPDPVEIIDDFDPGAPVAATMIQVDKDAYDEMVADYQRVLAENTIFGEVVEADDRLKAAMASTVAALTEAAKQTAIAENIKRTMDAKSGEFIERARAVTYWKNRAEKAEKTLAKMEKAK